MSQGPDERHRERLEHRDPSDRVGGNPYVARQRAIVDVSLGEMQPPPIVGNQHSTERLAPLDLGNRGLDLAIATLMVGPIAVLELQPGSDRDQRWPPFVVGAHVERGPHELRRGGVGDAGAS